MPSPSTPILELILEEMRSTIDAATAGSSYHYSWAAKLFEDYAINPKDSGFASPTAIIKPLNSVPELSAQAGGESFMDTPLRVSVFGIYHEGASRSDGGATEKCARMEADLAKLLIAGTSYTRGGYAFSTKFIGTEFFPEEFNYLDASVELVFEILFRRKSGDLAAQV